MGTRLALVLEHLRFIGEAAHLREHYGADDMMAAIPDEQHAVAEGRPPPGWQVYDAAYGLRWLEITHGLRFDLSRSLVPQLPLPLLHAASTDTATED